MNRYYTNNNGLFKKSSGERMEFRECFRAIPVGNADLGVGVALSYGFKPDPLCSLVKLRFNPVSSSYISLTIEELEALITAIQNEDFIKATQPTTPTFVVSQLERPLVMSKKEWSGKPWTLFTLEQMRKGRKYVFDTPSFNIDKILNTLILTHELARVRSLELDPVATHQFALPLMIAALVHSKITTGKSFDDLIDSVIEDREQLENLFAEIITKIQPNLGNLFIGDDEEVKQAAYIGARKVYQENVVDEEAIINPQLILLIINEYFKTKQC